MEGYWFKSNLFEVEPGEDEKTNPGCYGKQLSLWLRDKLSSLGYKVEDVIPEDWGWCVMCSREPYLLWVGCGSVQDAPTEENTVPPKQAAITWHCFAVAEVPFWKKLFGTIDTTPAVSKLTRELESILKSEKQITLLEQP